MNWSDDRSEVKFEPYRAYVFDPETSCENCSDTKDKVTTVNIPLMVSCNIYIQKRLILIQIPMFKFITL